jgi:hypothetical protein
MTYLYPTVKRAIVLVIALLFTADAVLAQANSSNLPLSPSQPVSLLAFQVNLKEKNAVLSWTTTNHYKFSHFIIEKSNDAKNYTEATILFADETNSVENSFKYKDNLLNNTEKTTYYRLKLVDINGKASYSETRMVRLSEENKVQISTFPNPAINEVRVMIPTDWQEKLVTYEIYSNAGVLIQRYQNKQAAQVQHLNVQQLNSGNYLLKVNNGTTSTISNFVKY